MPKRNLKPERRPAAKNPKGFQDYFADEVNSRKAMLDQISVVFQKFGFEPLETPAIEGLDALGKFLPDLDRPHEGVFAWQDEESWIALRYDLTAPLSRVVAQYRQNLPTPYRRYAIGPVWRNEKPGPGRFRQFYQCDADTVGSLSMAADAEMCALTCEIIETLGINRGDYIVRVNNRKLLDGVLEQAGVASTTDTSQRSLAVRDTVLRAIDKLDRIGTNGVRDLLGSGRLDASGDFTAGADLSSEQTEFILTFISSLDKGNAETLIKLSDVLGTSTVGRKGIEELEEIFELLYSQDIGQERVFIDPSIVRGLGYYTGPVMEAELTHEIRNHHGRIQRFGSVAGGGRYDGLVRRFTGQDVPATGVSIGVDRLLAALDASGVIDTKSSGPVLITVMDRERMADYQVMAAELRNDGIRAEVYLGNARNFGRQLKYADVRNCPVAVIEGAHERAKGVVQLKDLDLGSRIAETATHEEWKTRPSQIEIPRADLVPAIRKILGANG